MSKVEELKAKVLKAQQEADIASLYVLESQAHEVFDEETLHGYYANILDLALERLTETLEAKTQFDISEVQDFATLRALYEYAIEHYHADQKKDAAALFEILSGLSNDKKFSDAMQIHQAAAQSDLSLDQFLEKIADIATTQEQKSFYINAFTKEAQKLLKDSQSKGDN
ncbi:MAG: hypothetical protein FAF05_01915 [Epsilonproteobacteria bacterium]|nr:hypothetical protein [Campylobacterota bacterium]